MVEELWPAAPEFDYVVLALQAQSRFIDNDTSYGSLRVLIDTAGDRTIASAEVDQTFDAAAELFTDRNIASSSDPGVAYRSMIVRLILNHEAASAETPDALPLAIFSYAQGRALERFAVELDFFQPAYQSPVHLLNALKTLKATKGIQRFSGGGYDTPAALVEVSFDETQPTMGSIPPNWRDVKKPIAIFERTIGGLS